MFHERTKHVETNCYFVCEHVESKDIHHMHIHTTHQAVDLFTKALGSQRLHFSLNKLDIQNLHAPT